MDELRGRKITLPSGSIAWWPCHISSDYIGPGAVITNDRHPPSGGLWKPVCIDDDVVIGANATIVAGVKLHSKCVIAAGSVVSTDVPANEVWAEFLPSSL